jgi:hypothetical protein
MNIDPILANIDALLRCEPRPSRRVTAAMVAARLDNTLTLIEEALATKGKQS